MDRSKWEYKKLGDITKISSGKAIPSSEISEVFIEGFYPCYGGNGLRGYVNQYSNDGLIPVIGRVGALCGNVHLPQGKFYATEHALVVSLKTNDTPHYIEYLLNSLNLRQYAKGVAQPVLSASTLSEILIPIPPIADQQRIVAELDCLNEMIAVKQEQLKEFDKLAQSIFYDMFGDPLVNDKNWKSSSYGKEFEIGSGGTPSKSISDYWENGDIPWIGSNMCQNCFIYDNDGKFITEKGLKNSSAKVLKSGTILFALVGATIGKVGILKKETTTNQNIAFVNVWKSDVFDSIFVFFHSMKLYPLFMNLGNGGFKMANQSFIKDLPIILPPLSLQQEFADKISAIEAQKELVKQSIAETQSLLDYTMDYYFNE